MRYLQIAYLSFLIASCLVHLGEAYTTRPKPAVCGPKCCDPLCISRRGFVASIGSSLLLTTKGSRPESAFAVDSGSSFYNDEVHGFSIQVPASWTFSEQTLPDRRKISLWKDPDDQSGQTVVFVAYTPVRDDFTSITSFGSVEQVAAQTILPKGQLAGVDVSSELLSASAKNQAYYFDYTQSVPDLQPLTHVRAIFSLQQGATGGAGAVLVTVTAQAPEELYQRKKDMFDRIVNSYGKAVPSSTFTA
jgi:hypothetical protein